VNGITLRFERSRLRGLAQILRDTTYIIICVICVIIIGVVHEKSLSFEAFPYCAREREDRRIEKPANKWEKRLEVPRSHSISLLIA
jgi:hypothetical protein